jgi:drug/metabolite transporter (DMT)-like permease
VTPETFAIALSLVASLAWGVSDFLGGQVSRRTPVLWVVAVSYLSGLILIAAAALIAGGSLPAEEAAIAVLGGISGAVAIALFYVAMAIGPVSIISPLVSMGVVVPVAVGLIRGESPSGVQIAGLVAALCGIALAVREAEAPHSVSISTRSLVLAGLAGLGFGLFFVAIDSAASDNALWAATWARAGGTVAIGLALIVRPPRQGLTLVALPVLLLIGCLDAAANTLIAVASSLGLLALVAVGGSLFPIVTVVLARVVLGERLARIQQLGVALALAGVLLIASG